ncbi:hypothetical protein ACP70R_030395 [Stipagrostis hirtigluma subsp. patula]
MAAAAAEHSGDYLRRFVAKTEWTGGGWLRAGEEDDGGPICGEDGRGYELARRLEACGAWRAWLGDDAALAPSPPCPLLHLQLRARALLFDKASARQRGVARRVVAGGGWLRAGEEDGGGPARRPGSGGGRRRRRPQTTGRSTGGAGWLLAGGWLQAGEEDGGGPARRLGSGEGRRRRQAPDGREVDGELWGGRRRIVGRKKKDKDNFVRKIFDGHYTGVTITRWAFYRSPATNGHLSEATF